MKKFFCFIASALFCAQLSAKEPVEYVNPFIGSSNFGTTHPGAVCPNGMMSVVPFNVMGSELNRFDKDSRWWSTPYDVRNKYLTGFSHVNLSGVGCPDLGSLLLMPTTGELNVDFREYGSEYKDEYAEPGYYTTTLTKYGVKAEASASTRVGISRFTFPAGQGNILLNLGQGLTNESGAYVRRVSDTEIEGMKVLGTFCYNPEAVFPIYFAVRVNKSPTESGWWKYQRPKKGPAGSWDEYDSKYKIYRDYGHDMAGDDIGAWFSFDTAEGEAIEVQVGVSFTSVENAWLNLKSEQEITDFDGVRRKAKRSWNDHLSRIKVEGGTEEQKTVFYTGLYHTLIHPNVINDVYGDYPEMENGRIGNTSGDRYTVFSLWDTYRNLHQLLALVYPEKQEAMLNSMIGMYKESGWLPKWELYARETLTMSGDPAIPVIVDSYLKGFRNFDTELAYEAMYKSALLPGVIYENDEIAKQKDRPDSYVVLKNEGSMPGFNRLRPDNSDYMRLGYVPMRSRYDNSVSNALEYYIADYALSRFAGELGKKKDAEMFRNRSMGYKHYYSKEYGTFRPLLPDGSFLTPFDPVVGANFEPNPGFHEGSAWNYAFYVPHDVYGLAKLMGGNKKFVEKLQMVFDKKLYDPANEPDIAYPYLFSYFKGEEWRTQKLVNKLLATYYNASPAGIPGNDDTGTMSAWAVFSMIGLYPDNPGDPSYTLTSPVFDRVTIQLDKKYYPKGELVIEAPRADSDAIYIKGIELGGRKYNSYRIDHKDLVSAGTLKFELYNRK